MSARLQRTPLSLPAAFRALADPGLGGVVVFAGRVRPDVTRAGRVVALVYEAHRAPALEAIARLEREAARRFGVQRTVAWHRVGRVRVGEVAVIVGAAGGHRKESFEAARFLIEELKRTVPVWKEARARPARPPRRPRARRAGRSTG
jgi:molybdopterin synthase catalytic subunit